MLLWGTLGAVVLIVGIVLIANSGKSNSKEDDRNEMASYKAPPRTETPANVPSAPKKQAWEIEEERKTRELAEKFQPAAIRNDADWQTFVSLVEKAEGLCGISRGDGRESVLGRTEEQLKEAKRSIERADGIIDGNRTLKSLTTEYGSVLSADARFDFVSDYISRHGGLKLKLKGVKLD
ncbi:MAG: hypothetical protein H6834_13065 [Planctomycetes bacterium]|nr:hypothetical protein [Planctomycetota bacterium]